MKRILLMLVLISAVIGTKAQGLGDIFNQKKKEKQNMIQQILFTKTYKEALKSGYKICKTGWSTVHGFKNGEYSLHHLFLNSLKGVNPMIRKYVRVGQIINMQVQILKTYHQSYSSIQASKMYTESEVRYIYLVFGRLLDDCEKAVGELTAILTEGTMEMKDDERIERIDALYEDMTDRTAFASHFSTEAIQLGQLRQREGTNDNMLKQIYGLK